MSSMNRVNITGNLTRDPELRMTPGGMSVLSIGVAVNDRRKNNQTGEWEDYPNFIDCVVFGQRADSLSKILAKGMKVGIDGKLRQDRWQDKQTGQNRSKIEVVVDDLDFMSNKGQGGQQQAGYQRQQPSPQPAYQTQQPAPVPVYQAPAPVAQPVQQAAPVAQPVQAVQPVQAAPVAQPVQQVQQPLPTGQGDPASVYDPDIPF